MTKSLGPTRVTSCRALLCTAALGIAIASSGSGIALAATGGLATAAANPSQAATSVAATDASAYVNTWQFVDMTVSEEITGTDAQDMQSLIALMKAMGFTAELDIAADGTYSMSVTVPMDESASEQTTGTWEVTADGIAMTDGDTGLTDMASLQADGTLAFESEGVRLVFATADAVASGAFAPSASADTVTYVKNPKDFPGTWALVGMSSEEEGLSFDEDTFALMGALGLSGEMQINKDGTFSMTLMVPGEEPDAAKGTWTATSATEGTFTVEGNPVKGTIKDGRLTLSSDGVTMSFAMVDTDGMKTSSASSRADAKSSAAAAKKGASKSATATTSADVAAIAGAWEYAGVASDSPSGDVTSDYFLELAASQNPKVSFTVADGGKATLSLAGASTEDYAGTVEALDATHYVFTTTDGDQLTVEYDATEDVIGLASARDDGYTDYIILTRA